ncbi:MAG: oligosaccharide flippase family protein [Actinomycetota bacterium]|nr:oligosaccharide flippase family protein [Actinomycetota bacterium]
MNERVHLAEPSDPDGLPVDPLPAIQNVELLPARRATRAVLLVLGLRLVGALTGVVVAGLLSRQLGPAGFGELSVIFTVAILASTVAEFGTNYVVVAEMAAHPWRRRELAAGLALVRGVAGALLATTGSVVLVGVFDRPDAAWAGGAVLATLPLAALTGLTVLHQARLRPEIGAALSLGQSVLWLVAVVVAGTLGASLAFYGLAYLLVGLVQAAAAWATVGREHPAWSCWRPAAGWIVRRSWPLGIATVLGAVYYRLDAVLVFELSGADAAGFYSAAYRFLDVLQLVPAALAGVLVPLFASACARGDREGSERVLRLAVTVAAAVALPVAAGAFVAADRIAVAVFGPAFTPTGDVLAVLPLAFFSITTGYMYAAMLVALGQVRVLAVVAALAAVLSVTADLIVIPTWGAVGAAWITVCVEYLVTTCLALWLRSRIGFRLPWPRIGAAAAASAVLVAVAWPLRSAPLPLLLVVPSVAYLIAATSFRAVTRADLRVLVHPALALGSPPEDSP